MQEAGTKRTGVPVKTLKKLLKRAGLKVSGKKATLTRRAKKAKLFGGLGAPPKSTMKSFITKTIQTNPELIASKAEAAQLQATTAVNNEAALIKANNQNARVAVEEAARQRGDFYHQPNGGSGKKKRSRRS